MRENPLQRIRPALEGNFGLVLHHPKPLARAGDFLRRRAYEYPALDGLQQHLQFAHASQPCIDRSQFTCRSIGDGFAFPVGGIPRQRPGLFPRFERKGVVGRVVVFQTQVGEQRRAPGRLEMPFQKPREAGEIIRPAALRVAEQRPGERGVLVRTRLAANRNKRLLENASSKKLLDGRFGGKLEARLRRLNPWDGPVYFDGRWRCLGRGRPGGGLAASHDWDQHGKINQAFPAGRKRAEAF